jgi:transposase
VLTFPPTVRIYLCREAIDMRKSYDGLSGCVQERIGADPLSGHLFVFFNRRRTQVKVLMWDRTGYCLYCKRLERGRFTYADAGSMVDMPQLQMILEGIDLGGAHRRRRFRLP